MWAFIGTLEEDVLVSVFQFMSFLVEHDILWNNELKDAKNILSLVKSIKFNIFTLFPSFPTFLENWEILSITKFEKLKKMKTFVILTFKMEES